MSTSWKNKNEELARFWKTHIDQWAASGLTQTEYCRRNEISRDRFTYWKRKFKRQDLSVEFIQLPVPIQNKAVGLKLNIGQDLQIEIPDGFTSETLERVLLTLKVVS